MDAIFSPASGKWSWRQWMKNGSIAILPTGYRGDLNTRGGGHGPWARWRPTKSVGPPEQRRAVYALALWQGHRRGDIAALRPEDVAGDLMRMRQQKTDKDMTLPIVASLREVLDATDMSGKTILQTAYKKPFSAKSLTGHMALWTKKAGLEPGCTIHGLRKTLGKLMAEGGASTRELMGALGHDDIAHAELYTREAEQARLAKQGIEAAVAVFSGKKRAV